MKTLLNFLSSNPSYVKCSAKRIAERTNLKESTVKRFRKTNLYKHISSEYLNKN